MKYLPEDDYDDCENLGQLSLVVTMRWIHIIKLSTVVSFVKQITPDSETVAQDRHIRNRLHVINAINIQKCDHVKITPK